MQLRPRLPKNAEPTSASRCQETFRGMFDPVMHFATFSLPLKQHLRTFNPRYPPLKTCQSRSARNRKASRGVGWGGGGEFICLPHDLKSPSKANNRKCSVAFRRLLFRHYVYLHCSQLRACEKPSKHSSLIPRDPGLC